MRGLQRIGALCLIAALSAWLFYAGREHQIFLDNRTIEVEGQSFRALEYVRITVEDSEPVDLMPRDRDLAKVVGPSFRLKVEVMDEYGDEVERVIEKDLYMGFSKDVMLSMPLLAADREDYILPPPTAQAPPPEEPETPPDELGADVVGGIPWIEYTEADQKAHIDRMFALAKKYGKDVSMLLDDVGDGGEKTLEMFAAKVLEQGWEAAPPRSTAEP